MGFTQLLAANRSLRNIKSGPSRYKMNQANLLPKFGMEKSSKTEDLPALSESDTRPGIAEPVAPAAPLAPASEPHQGIVTQAVKNQQIKNKIDLTSRLTAWVRFRNPFGAKTGKHRSTPPIQTELGLDTVKPVRNDLDDEEFTSSSRVMKTPAPSALSSPFAPAAIRPAQAPGLWRRWKDRIFGSRNRF